MLAFVSLQPPFHTDVDSVLLRLQEKAHFLAEVGARLSPPPPPPRRRSAAPPVGLIRAALQQPRAGGGKSDAVAPGTYLLLLHNAVTFITGFVLAAVQANHFALCHFQLPSLSICPPLCCCLHFHAVKSARPPFKSCHADSIADSDLLPDRRSQQKHERLFFFL